MNKYRIFVENSYLQISIERDQHLARSKILTPLKTSLKLAHALSPRFNFFNQYQFIGSPLLVQYSIARQIHLDHMLFDLALYARPVNRSVRQLLPAL